MTRDGGGEPRENTAGKWEEERVSWCRWSAWLNVVMRLVERMGPGIDQLVAMG